MSSTTITTADLINAAIKDTLSAIFDNCPDEHKAMISKLIGDQETFIPGRSESTSARIETNGKPLKEDKVKENIGKALNGTDGTFYTVVERDNNKAKNGKSLHFVSCDENGAAKEIHKGSGHLKPNESEPFTEANENGEEIRRTNVPGGEGTLWNASIKKIDLGHNQEHVANVWVQVKEKKPRKGKKISTTPTEDAKELDVGTLSKGSCLNKDGKEEYYVVAPFTIAKDIFQNRWQKITDKQWKAEEGETIKKGEKTWLVSKNDEGEKCWVLQ